MQCPAFTFARKYIDRDPRVSPRESGDVTIAGNELDPCKEVHIAFSITVLSGICRKQNASYGCVPHTANSLLNKVSKSLFSVTEKASV